MNGCSASPSPLPNRDRKGAAGAPHWHNSNERILLFEGRLKLGESSLLEPGGYAFLPAREVHVLRGLGWEFQIASASRATA